MVQEAQVLNMENSKNKILTYLSDIEYMAKNDEGGYLHLLSQGDKETATLKEISFALLAIIDDFEAMLSASQLLQELRLQSIVAHLDEETQEKIISEFNEVGDDLFTEEANINDND